MRVMLYVISTETLSIMDFECNLKYKTDVCLVYIEAGVMFMSVLQGLDLSILPGAEQFQQ